MRDGRSVEPIVVLGGGLAGLAAGIASGGPVYEATERVGGVAASDVRDGFTFDRGIHVLQAASERVMQLLTEVGVEFDLHSRQAFIYSHGTYTPYPFQVNTAGLPLALRLRCVRDFLSRPKDSRPVNYEEWIHASVGRSFAETFLIPYSEKFWTVSPREMTHEWTGNRVPQPRMRQVLRGALWARQTRIGTNSSFRYPSSVLGYGAVGEALAQRVGRLYRGHRAVGIDTQARTVRFQNGHATGFQRLITTLPLPELVALCPEAPDEVRQAASRLRTNSICVVNLGIGRPGRNDWHWAHFPEKDISFFRISFPHNFARGAVPEGMSSVSAEVAYNATNPVDPARLTERVIDDLRRVGVIAPDDPIVHRSTHDIRYAYCIHDFARKEAVRTIRSWMQRHGVVPTGRYGHWNYFWSHEALMSGLQSGEKALKQIHSGGGDEPDDT